MKWPRRILKLGFVLSLIGGLAGAGALLGAYLYISPDLPDIEELRKVQPHGAAVHQVNEATGCGDQNVDSLVKSSDLFLLTDTPEDDGVAYLQITAIIEDAVSNLGSQFPGRSQDQCPGPFSDGGLSLFGQVI